MPRFLFIPGCATILPGILLAIFCIICCPVLAPAAAPADLDFSELYVSQGPLGFKFSEKLLSLKDREVRITGFMAPPLKADGDFFVLTREPVSLCPFCNSDADWPMDIIVAYMAEGERFVQNNAPIAAEGVLEIGSQTDEKTGFVSQLRLRNTRISRL